MRKINSWLVVCSKKKKKKHTKKQMRLFEKKEVKFLKRSE